MIAEHLLKLAIGFTAAIFSVCPSFADESPTSKNRLAESVPSDSNSGLATLLKSHLTHLVAKRQIPGLVFVLVKEGAVVFSNGFGFANVEKKIPVDPKTTVYRVGSMSKPFTATAVMQMVERGKLDLHADVNTYLTDFQLDKHFTRPVTLSDLLTHSAGLDNIQTDAYSFEHLTPLGDYLRLSLPPRVTSPGEEMSYSNYGMALAGYLVESASGISFPQYMRKNILSPLQMDRSTFDQPIPSELGAELRPAPFINHSPSGALVATGDDMSHFLLAHLQEGRFKEKSILEKTSIALMHQTQFLQHQKLPGTPYGFLEDLNLRHNIRAIWHGSNWMGGGALYLVPEKHFPRTHGSVASI